ncbi:MULTISPECIES: DegV family protein [Pediococcus]|uniref:DegV family protein n=1 Tax=Pediococcus TaxID=1253 RepID=UPI00070D4874|nr:MULTISPECIES: DegV family protein [Pediococcus]MCT3026422.1 DegV family protein [Pediococcus parvulus]MCT3028504.1 DegV family protein [Pediococcus parvulus]MCT3031415.1 DegV family protein [Pediococcus parvulus]MCT3034139.1 DegV family protein [Pediococcus parvulus]MDN5574490.1 DegV family protein [Pediococcus sp.]
MSKIKIVTDSSCGVTDQEVADYNITIVPLTVMIDDTIYVERETITNEEFLNKMQTSKALPKTSQPPIGKFVEVFDKLGEDGSQIICFNMLEAISGTVHAAEQAAQLSKADVTVVDSQTTDRALAFQVIEAAKLAQQGKSRDEILKAAEDIRDHTKLFMGVMTLDNLVKGGRINRMTGMISGLLNIKIVLQVTGGELKVVAKGRGMKTISHFFDDVYEKMAKSPNIKSIGISHVGALKTIAPIKAKIHEMFPDINILVRETVPIIATHGGPGAFALMYYTGD